MAVIVLADVETHGDLGRIANALTALNESKEAGDHGESATFAARTLSSAPKGTRAKYTGAGHLVPDRFERSVQLVVRPHELSDPLRIGTLENQRDMSTRATQVSAGASRRVMRS